MAEIRIGQGNVFMTRDGELLDPETITIRVRNAGLLTPDGEPVVIEYVQHLDEEEQALIDFGEETPTEE